MNLFYASFLECGKHARDCTNLCKAKTSNDNVVSMWWFNLKYSTGLYEHLCLNLSFFCADFGITSPPKGMDKLG